MGPNRFQPAREISDRNWVYSHRIKQVFVCYNLGNVRMIKRKKAGRMSKREKVIEEPLIIENPFEKVTVEQFNDDYDLIAYLFAKPEQAIYNKLVGRENYIIVGGWGSGKTMILKYLGLETQIADIGVKKVKDSDFIGLYIKGGRGSFKPFLQPGGDFKPSGEILFSHYFNLLILEKIILVVLYGKSKGVFDVSGEMENELCKRIESKFSFIHRKRKGDLRALVPEIYNLEELKRQVADWRREIETFLNLRDLDENLPYTAQLSIHPTNLRTFLDESIREFRETIPSLSQKRFYILLDECEQFSKGQQKVINTIIKQRLTTLVFKLATRPPDIQTIKTIDPGIGLTDRECKHLYLDREYDPTSASFRKLCKEVAEKRLEKYGYPIKDIIQILGKHSVEDEIGTEEIISYLRENYPSEERISDKDKLQTVYKDFKVAAVFQILSKKGFKKKYAGFKTFVMLSSGIMVHFLELCRDLFNLSIGKGITRDKSGNISFEQIPLPTEIQDKAAESISESFYRDIRGRAESLRDSPIDIEFGDRIQNMILILGGIFREKLMTFNEPEAARIEIPEGISALDSSLNNPIQQMYYNAIAISALQEGNPYMPQHIGGIRPPTYILNRILAPYLKISPRPRWRTEIRAELFNKILTVGGNEFKKDVLGRKAKKGEVKTTSVPEIQATLPFELSESMPVLNYLSNKIKNQPFQGKTLLILLHLLRDLIPFIEACKKIGALPSNTIIFYKDYRYRSKKEIQDKLETGRYKVYPIEEINSVLKQLESGIVANLVIIEDGGIIVPKLHTDFEKLAAATTGAVEQTTKGIRNDQQISRCLFPIISIPGSKLKDTFEPPHIARTVVNSIQRLLPEKNFSGMNVLVIGYGSIGEQIALQLRDTLKTKVSIYDLDNTKLIKAQQYGFDIEEDLRHGVNNKFLIVGATGETVIGRSEILAMEHNVYLVSASSEQWEFCISELNALSSESSDIHHDEKKIGTRYKITNTEKQVNLIADGYPINFWEAESMPSEVSDLIMSLIFLSAIEITTNSALTPGMNYEIANALAEKYELDKIYLEHHNK